MVKAQGPTGTSREGPWSDQQGPAGRDPGQGPAGTSREGPWSDERGGPRSVQSLPSMNPLWPTAHSWLVNGNRKWANLKTVLSARAQIVLKLTNTKHKKGTNIDTKHNILEEVCNTNKTICDDYERGCAHDLCRTEFRLMMMTTTTVLC